MSSECPKWPWLSALLQTQGRAGNQERDIDGSVILPVIEFMTAGVTQPVVMLSSHAKSFLGESVEKEEGIC